MAGLLVGAVAVALYTWDQLAGVTMSIHGIIALVLGVVISLALGMGLMALVFYSNRKGYDQIDGGPPAFPEHRDATSDDPEPPVRADRR
jgi:hypothetical protein